MPWAGYASAPGRLTGAGVGVRLWRTRSGRSRSSPGRSKARVTAGVTMPAVGTGGTICLVGVTFVGPGVGVKGAFPLGVGVAVGGFGVGVGIVLVGGRVTTGDTTAVTGTPTPVVGVGRSLVTFATGVCVGFGRVSVGRTLVSVGVIRGRGVTDGFGVGVP